MMNLSLAELEKKRRELWEEINPKLPPSRENDWVMFALYNSLWVRKYMQENGQVPEEDEIDMAANRYYQEKCR